MDIHDIKRLPAQFDSPQTRGQVDKAKTEKAKEPDSSAKPVEAKGESPESAKAAAPKEDIAQAVEQLKVHAQNLDRELQFQIDSDTGTTVVTIKDAATQEVLRQIPSEEMLEIAKSLESAQGVIFDSKA